MIKCIDCCLTAALWFKSKTIFPQLPTFSHLFFQKNLSTFPHSEQDIDIQRFIGYAFFYRWKKNINQLHFLLCFTKLLKIQAIPRGAFLVLLHEKHKKMTALVKLSSYFH